MKPSEREKANDHQLQIFFGSYEPTWRLTKLLSLRMLLEEREELQVQLRNYYGEGFNCDQNYIFKQTTNGLVFSAISELLMYCEDLFLMLKLIRDKEYFVKKVVQYQAGTVTNLVGKLEKFSADQILKLFMVPSVKYLEQILKMSRQSAEDKQRSLYQYKQAVETLQMYLKDIITTFRYYEFFYNQYKHGLTVALKPFPAPLPQETIEQMRQDLFGFPVCYDNDTIEVTIKKGRLKNTALIIPSLHSSIKPYLRELIEERNLLRYYAPDNVRLDDLIEIARKIAVLLLCLISNRLGFVSPKNAGYNTVSLPVPRPPTPLARFEVRFANKTLKLTDFDVST